MLVLVLGRVYVDRLLKELLRELETFTGGRAYELADLDCEFVILLRVFACEALLEFEILVELPELILEVLELLCPATAVLSDDLEELPAPLIADFVPESLEPKPDLEEYIR